MEQDKLMALTGPTHSALLLRHFDTSRRLYPTDIDNAECQAIRDTLVQKMESALSHEAWEGVEYQTLDYNDDNVLVLIMATGSIRLARIIGVDKDHLINKGNVNEVIEATYQHLPDEFREYFERIYEILIYDCLIPHPVDTDEYHQTGRYFFLLGKYWHLYSSLLQTHCTTPIGYIPHPLLRFITNLKVRINKCLDMLENKTLANKIREIMDIPFDMDSSNLWEEWVQPEISEAEEAYELVRIHIKPSNYELTEAEKIFISVCKEKSREYAVHINKKWKTVLEQTDKNAQQNISSQNVSLPKTCFEYISFVEQNLRQLVRRVYQREYTGNWLVEVREVVGDKAYDNAAKTMNQRQVFDSNELLHFTQLNDVYRLISQRWQLFSDSFNIRRKEFNNLMNTIIKGRTEEAHNRPEHLWPDIEKQRVSVACNDLIDAISACLDNEE